MFKCSECRFKLLMKLEYRTFERLSNVYENCELLLLPVRSGRGVKVDVLKPLCIIPGAHPAERKSICPCILAQAWIHMVPRRGPGCRDHPLRGNTAGQ